MVSCTLNYCISTLLFHSIVGCWLAWTENQWDISSQGELFCLMYYKLQQCWYFMELWTSQKEEYVCCFYDFFSLLKISKLSAEAILFAFECNSSLESIREFDMRKTVFLPEPRLYCTWILHKDIDRCPCVPALLWNLILEEDIIKIEISYLESCRLK